MANKCPKCQTDNPDDSKFCKECAVPMRGSEEITHIKTLENPTEEITSGLTFVRRHQIIGELGKRGIRRAAILIMILVFMGSMGLTKHIFQTGNQKANKNYPQPPYLINMLKKNVAEQTLTKKELSLFLEYSSSKIGNIQLVFCDEEFNLKFSDHISERVGKAITVGYMFHALNPNVTIDYVAKNYPISIQTEKEDIYSLYPTNIILNNLGDPEIPKLIGNHSPNGYLKGNRLWILLFPKIKVDQIKGAIFKFNSEMISLKKKKSWEQNKTIIDIFTSELR